MPSKPAHPVTILIVDHRAAEADRLVAALRRDGFDPDWSRVSTEKEYLRHLSERLDFILASDGVPSFDVLSALAHLTASGLNVPLIVVTPSRPSSRTADEWLARGSSGYVSRPGVLGPAVRRALHQRALAREIQARERRHGIMAALARKALGVTSLTALFDEAVDAVARTLDVEFVKVLEVVPSGELLLRAGVGWKDGVVGTATVGAGTESQAGYTLVSNGPVLVDDLRTETRFTGPPLLLDHGIVSGISAPIDGKEHPFGVLGAHTATSRRFTTHEASFLQGVASVLGAAVERKLGEDALRANEERFRLLAEHAQDVVYRYRLLPTPGFEYVSPSATRMTGYTPEDHYADPMLGFKIVVPEDRPVVEAMIRALQERDPQATGPVFLRWVRKDGTLMWTGQRNVGIYDEAGDLVAIEGIARDVTAAKLAEQSVAASERRFRALVEHSWDGIALSSADGVFLYASPSIARITGYAPEELIGRSGFPFVHPDDLPRVTLSLEEMLRGESPSGPLEFRIRHKDGSWRSIEGVTTNLLDDPAVGALVFNFRDVTSRNEAEAALRESDETYRAVVENLVEGVTITVGDKRVFVNDAFMRIHGLTDRRAVINRRVDRFIVPEERQLVRERTLARQRGESLPTRDQYHARRADGDIRTIEVSAVKITYRGRPASLAVVQDVTEREQAAEALHQREETLRHAQKMEAVGLLAGGVAHDFNNVLTAIVGHAELALSKLPPDSRLHFNVSQISAGAAHAAALTRQLLAVSRGQLLTPEVLDLNALVEDIATLLRQVIGEDVELTTVHDPELSRVEVDRSQMEQVIMNLAVNARDAMPDGGKLTISMANVPVAVTGGRSGADESGPRVMLAVTDTGVGMDAETQARAFEPFFTTKERGKGSGLGLSTVYGIVKQSGGAVQVESAAGLGTTVRVLLPPTETAEEPAEATPVAAAPARGSETILLVEDDAPVRGVAKTALEALGYTVLQAANGDDATVVSASHDGPVHLLVTDVIMPGASGPQVARAITASRTGTKVLLISGHLGDGGTTGSVLPAGAAYLAKPFSPAELGRKVRDVLDGHTSR